MQGAPRGTRFWDSRIVPWAKGRRQTSAPPRDPYFFFFKIYLFIHEGHRDRERGRDMGRGRSRLHAGSPTRDSTPGLQDHTPGVKVALNR